MRAACLLAALLAAGCGLDGAPFSLPSVAPDSVVLRVGYAGGLCRTGACSSSTQFRADGKVLNGEKAKVAKALVDAVRTEIAKADFKAIQAKPFTGTCPSAYDGNEVTYTFATAQGEVAIGSCKVAIDHKHPLFVAVGKLLDAAQAEEEEED